MKTLFTRALALSLATLTLWCTSAPAQTTGSADDLFRTFSKCDRTFFDKLTAEHDTWSQQMTLGNNNGIAYPLVPNRLQTGQQIQRFAHPLIVNGVELVGYFDSAYALNPLLKNFDWGFIIKTPKDQAIAGLKPLIANQERFLATAEGAWQRGEHKNFAAADNQWQDGTTSMGQAPAPDTVERDFYVISGDYAGPDESEVTCSIQGFVPADLIHAIRPDLDQAALALAMSTSAAGTTTSTVYTAPDGSFKIKAPGGWVPNTLVPINARNPAQLILKKTDVGPFLQIRRYNAQDIVDWQAFNRMLLGMATNMTHPTSVPLQVQPIKINGNDALQVAYTGTMGPTPVHVMVTMMHNEKSVIYMISVCTDVNYAAYRDEVAQLPAAVQY